MARANRNTGKRTSNSKHAARPQGTGRIPAFAMGLVGGLVLALTLTLLGVWPSTSTSTPTPQHAQEASQPPSGVRFEFPDMLRDSEALVPYVEEYLEEESAPPAEAHVSFLLQAGAFRNPDDANRRRAQILLLDLNARTLEVARDGTTWHRVLVGPFGDRNQVRSAQLRLLEDSIDSIVLRTDPT